MRVIRYFVLLILPLLLLLRGYVFGEKNGEEMSTLIDEIISFFPDIKAEVIETDSSRVMINKGNNAGIKKGMRLTATTKTVLRHPVTQEVVGEVDVKSGLIEITDVSDDTSRGIVLKGSAVNGSTLLIPPSRIKVFFLDTGMDYIISDDYLRLMKDTGRFDIVESEDDSDISIRLSLDKAKGVLNEEVSWTDSKEVFLRKSINLSKDYLDMAEKRSSFYEEELKSSDLLLSFTLSGRVKFINVEDMDGDSSPDLIIARTSSIEIYRTGVSLKGMAEIKLNGELTGLYTLNINDRKLIFTPLLIDNEIESYVIEFREGELKILSKTKGILRPVVGRLFYQEFSPYHGPIGDIKEIEITGNEPPNIFRVKDVLKNIKNIYDFTFVDEDIISYDERGYLNLFDKEGRLLWRSETDIGGFENRYKALSTSPFLNPVEWHTGERIISIGKEIYIIQRKPLLRYAHGVGYTSSGIVKLKWNGKEMEYLSSEEIGGSVLDFQIYIERLYVLQKPFMGLSLKNIFKGQSPVVTRFYVFKLK